jgi:starch-binding outer membrane protein, SusD/RagB family
MIRHIRNAAAAALLVPFLGGCDTGILDVSPRDQLSEDMVFADPNLTEAFLNEIYRGMYHGFNLLMLASLTDEAKLNHGWGSDVIAQGLLGPSVRAADPIGWCCRLHHLDWSDNYARIRQANIFLSQIDGAEINEGLRNRMKGEALFLRANMYHNLVRMFGGVPLITHVYGLDEDYQVARNSFEETIAFILADADAAAELLPLSHSGANVGRATSGAALALKSRILTYAASELFHANPSGRAETGYTSAQDRAALWRAAKDAAREVMDLGEYALFRPNPASPEEATQNYADLFLQKTSEEAIMSRFFLVSKPEGGWDSHHPGLHNGPNGYHNWGGNTPLQNLVDDYLMADGSRFDWSNPAHAAAPYENRDPRFYASILYDGAQWRERPVNVKPLDPHGIVQTFRELRLPDGGTVPGLDTRAGPVEDWNGSYTGYYLRKAIDPTVNHQFTRQDVPWIFFRYAEILLNYAEASIELGELGDAHYALNQIRRRAGMPDLSAGLGQAALREAYRNERRIELAFEEHRFFDVRRWMIGPEVLSQPARGINIFLEGANRLDRDTWRNHRYEVSVVQQRAWDDKLYFMPIQRDEMNRNTALVQNPGY